MAYTVSASYHTAIKDGVSPQDFMLSDAEAVFNVLSTHDGDFVAGSPSISRSVCESQDFTLGECPAATLSVTLANPYGDGIEFWSKRGDSSLGTNVKAIAGIGVMTADTTSSSTTNKCDITVTFGPGSTKRIYVNSSGRLYVGTSYATGYSDAVSLHARKINDTTYMVFIGLSSGSVYAMNITNSTSSVPTRTSVTSSISGPMLRRLMKRGGAVYDSLGFPNMLTIYDTDSTYHSEAWEYCPVGLYYINPPKYNLYSATIAITDAMDPLSLLDTNLKELAEANSFEVTGPADAIINAICSAKGIRQRASYSTSPYVITVPEEAVTSDTTCRQFFRWVGERAGHLWRVDPIGFLDEYKPSAFSASDYELTSDHLAAGYEVYNEFVDKPEKLVIYYGNDQAYTSEAAVLTRTDYLKITGNPLYVSPDLESPEMPFLTYNDLPFPSYQIVDASTVSADPSYGYGDALTISTEDEYHTYIMRETLSFGVRVVSHYVSSGSNTRTDTEGSAYPGMMIGNINDQIGQLPELIGDTVDGTIDQVLQDAIGEGGVISDYVTQLTEDLISASDVSDMIGDLQTQIVNPDTIHQWIIDAVGQFENELSQYITWSDTTGLSIKAKDENGQPSPTFLNLQNDRLGFMYGDSMPAWMTSETFNINNLIAHNSVSLVGLIMQKITVGNVVHLRLS